MPNSWFSSIHTYTYIHWKIVLKIENIFLLRYIRMEKKIAYYYDGKIQYFYIYSTFRPSWKSEKHALSYWSWWVVNIRYLDKVGKCALFQAIICLMSKTTANSTRWACLRHQGIICGFGLALDSVYSFKERKKIN